MVTISSNSRKPPSLRWNQIKFINAFAVSICLLNLLRATILSQKKDSDGIRQVDGGDTGRSMSSGNDPTTKISLRGNDEQNATSKTDEALGRAKERGVILPDGTVTFTPEEFLAGRLENYVNLPNRPANPETDEYVKYLMEQAVPPPTEILMHEAPTPPVKNSIVGLASYGEFMSGWRNLVGSLRKNGYDGHIIVGVNKDIPKKERLYLDKMGVTYYAIETSNCTAAILDGVSNTSNSVRSVCSKGLEDLKLEWGRYEMARRWLNACESCTGWSMVIDTRDIFFQADPFRSLGDPDEAQHDLLFVEEIATHTNTLPDQPHRAKNLGSSPRYTSHVNPCYGKDNVDAASLLQRPMLCSGTVIGNKSGIHRFLSKLVDEFHKNNERGPQCRSPATTDQWTMNYLYYRGEFGFISRTKTLPWGTGPVLTVGTPCVNSLIPAPNHSQKDMIEFDEAGLIINPHEEKGAIDRIAPTLHQWDRCQKWINIWFFQHTNLFMNTFNPDDEPAVDWIADGK